jgi:hypothetical protein
LALVERVSGVVVADCGVREDVLVFGGILGVVLLDACDGVYIELAAFLSDDIISKTSESVDCHRICIMSAHTVGLVTVATSIVTRLGFSGIPPNPCVDVEYTFVRIPVRILAQKRPFWSALGPVPTK